MKNLIVIAITLFASILYGQDSRPYLNVSTPGAIIPLQSTSSDVHITGTIAHVKLTQVYHNTGSQPIEAQYVFPMSTSSAVHDMEMTIGLRTIKAQIEEKNKANKIYQKAIAQGKRAAKVDQHRPNVFQMNVGNIMPGDKLSIDLYYTELLVPENGQYRFVAPGVVGPRYTGESQQNEAWTTVAHTGEGAKSSLNHDIQVNIAAGMPISDVHSTTHKISTHFPDPSRAEINPNRNTANKDFILNYSFRGDAIQTGLMLHEGEDENFFCLLMEPPKIAKKEDVTGREYLFVMDISGSMTGFPLEVSKNLMKSLLGGMKPSDTFNVLFFAGGSQVLDTTPLDATSENITRAISFMDNRRGGGGTQLLNAMRTAYQMPHCNTSGSRTMVVITDGYISVEKEVFDIIQTNLNKANVFTFGIGPSVNRHLIEGMANIAQGQSFIVTDPSKTRATAKSFEHYINSPLLTQINLDFDGLDAYDVEPKSMPDVFASRPVLVYGKYRGSAKGNIKLSGYTGSTIFEKTFAVAEGNLSRDNEALKYLWARKRIQRLDDYSNITNDNTERAVTDLGLKYNLMTQYTSFVAVDNEVANDGSTKKINQPLPLPQNTLNQAIGAAADVKGQSKASKVITIEVASASGLELADVLRSKRWFSKLYGNLLKTKNITDNIQVTFDEAKGVIVKFWKNGQWIKSDYWSGVLELHQPMKGTLNTLTFTVKFK